MTAQSLNAWLADENATLEAGRHLANLLKPGMTVFLEGQLGAGKTTLTRGILQALGYSGAVKSPTYTLVEPYQVGPLLLYHFDLYRLADPEELEFMGIRDYFAEQALCLIEWPERGGDRIPKPDITITLTRRADQASAESGREVQLEAATKRGQNLLGELTKI